MRTGVGSRGQTDGHGFAGARRPSRAQTRTKTTRRPELTTGIRRRGRAQWRRQDVGCARLAMAQSALGCRHARASGTGSSSGAASCASRFQISVRPLQASVVLC